MDPSQQSVPENADQESPVQAEGVASTEGQSTAPASKPGWRGILGKVLPTKKAPKAKPSPNIYPLF